MTISQSWLICSFLSLNLINCIYRNSFHLRITEENIEVIGRDSHVINCRRDVDMVLENLLLQSALFWVNAATSVASRLGFQILQSHMNEFDVNYKQAPTILLLNTCSTRFV